MAELPPTYLTGVQFLGGLTPDGRLRFVGEIKTSQRVVDATGSMDHLREYLTSAIEDGLATCWPFDAPRPEDEIVTPLVTLGARSE